MCEKCHYTFKLSLLCKCIFIRKNSMKMSWNGFFIMLDDYVKRALVMVNSKGINASRLFAQTGALSQVTGYKHPS